MVEQLPPLLTVEEAALLLRIGRTKAYAMAREWRATDGRSGLPVVDFGHVLRVPRCQLEDIVGGPLDAVGMPVEASVGEQPEVRSATISDSDSAPAANPTGSTSASTTPDQPRSRTASTTRRRRRAPDHPTLPFTA